MTTQDDDEEMADAAAMPPPKPRPKPTKVSFQPYDHEAPTDEQIKFIDSSDDDSDDSSPHPMISSSLWRKATVCKTKVDIVKGFKDANEQATSLSLYSEPNPLSPPPKNRSNSNSAAKPQDRKRSASPSSNNLEEGKRSKDDNNPKHRPATELIDLKSLKIKVKFFRKGNLTCEQFPQKLHELSKTIISTDSYALFYVYDDEGCPQKTTIIPLVKTSDIKSSFDHYEENDSCICIIVSLLSTKTLNMLKGRGTQTLACLQDHSHNIRLERTSFACTTQTIGWIERVGLTNRQDNLENDIFNFLNRESMEYILVDVHSVIRERTKGTELIVTGDFNSSPSDKDMIEFISKSGLIDVHKYLFETETNTHERGSERIDYILVSPPLANAIRNYKILPPHSVGFTDHFCVVTEFDEKALFNNIQGLIRPKYDCAVRSKNQFKVKKYLKVITPIIKRRRITEILKALDSIPKSEWKGAHEILFNQVDRDVTRIMKRGNNALIKRKNIRRLWIPFSLPRNKDPASAREQFLNNRQKLSNPQTAKEIRQINSAEKRRRSFLRISNILHPTRGNGLMRVDIPPSWSPGENESQKVKRLKREHEGCRWSLVAGRDELEEILCRRNKAALSAAETTPGIQSPLGQKLLGPDRKYIEEQIFADQAPMEANEDEDFVNLISAITDPIKGTILGQITNEKLQKLIRGTKKRKASSISGRTHGHYKIWNEREDLRYIILTTINLPLRHGFSPERWWGILDVMLEKSAGNPRIDKLRIIQLIEADFNYALKIIWGKQLSYEAEQNGYIPDEQSGSRPQRDATHPALLKVLCLDFARVTKTPSVLLSNDATGCYDCIIPIIAKLVSKSVGLPDPSSESLHQTLINSWHKVRTGYGQSLVKFGSCESDSLNGTGQGSGASPILWCLISALILKKLLQKHKGKGFKTCDPQRKNLTETIGASFVDDTDFMSNSLTSNLNEAVPNVQKITQDYSLMLSATGGASSIPKTFYWSCEWDSEGTLLPQTPTDCCVVFKEDRTSPPQTITRLENHVSARTLGMWENPLSSNTTQIKSLSKNAKDWLSSIKSSNLSHQDVLVAFNCYLIPKLTYSFSVARITIPELKSLEQEYLGPALSKIGINRNFPRLLILSTTKYCGLGLPSLYTNMLIKKSLQ